MKQYIILGIIFIIIGFNIGHLIFIDNKKLLTTIKPKETVYFLEEGVYTNKKSLKVNITNLDNKVIINHNNKYYVYVGITKNKKVAQKIKKIYEQKGYQIIIKEKNNISEEFSINVEQFDLLIQATHDTDEIITIEEVVLANYQESLKK